MPIHLAGKKDFLLKQGFMREFKKYKKYAFFVKM